MSSIRSFRHNLGRLFTPSPGNGLALANVSLPSGTADLALYILNLEAQALFPSSGILSSATH